MFAQPKLSEVTLNFRCLSDKIQQYPLCQLNVGLVWNLQDLFDHQQRVYSEFQGMLQLFYTEVSETIRKLIN